MPAVLESPRVMAQKSESVLGSINRMSALPFVGDDPEDQHTVNNWRGDWDKWDTGTNGTRTASPGYPPRRATPTFSGRG